MTQISRKGFLETRSAADEGSEAECQRRSRRRRRSHRTLSLGRPRGLGGAGTGLLSTGREGQAAGHREGASRAQPGSLGGSAALVGVEVARSAPEGPPRTVRSSHAVHQPVDRCVVGERQQRVAADDRGEALVRGEHEHRSEDDAMLALDLVSGLPLLDREVLELHVDVSSGQPRKRDLDAQLAVQAERGLLVLLRDADREQPAVVADREGQGRSRPLGGDRVPVLVDEARPPGALIVEHGGGLSDGEGSLKPLVLLLHGRMGRVRSLETPLRVVAEPVEATDHARQPLRLLAQPLAIEPEPHHVDEDDAEGTTTERAHREPDLLAVAVASEDDAHNDAEDDEDGEVPLVPAEELVGRAPSELLAEERPAAGEGRRGHGGELGHDVVDGRLLGPHIEIGVAVVLRRTIRRSLVQGVTAQGLCCFGALHNCATSCFPVGGKCWA